MLRSSLAVILGFALWRVLWVAGGLVFQRAWPDAYPEPLTEPMTAVAPLAASLALSVVCSCVSGWLTALVARRRSAPVWILALLLLAVGVAVQSSVWNLLPLWYHASFLALLVPACLLGRRLAGRPA